MRARASPDPPHDQLNLDVDFTAGTALDLVLPPGGDYTCDDISSTAEDTGPTVATCALGTDGHAALRFDDQLSSDDVQGIVTAMEVRRAAERGPAIGGCRRGAASGARCRELEGGTQTQAATLTGFGPAHPGAGRLRHARQVHREHCRPHGGHQHHPPGHHRHLCCRRHCHRVCGAPLWPGIRCSRPDGHVPVWHVLDLLLCAGRL